MAIPVVVTAVDVVFVIFTIDVFDVTCSTINSTAIYEVDGILFPFSPMFNVVF